MAILKYAVFFALMLVISGKGFAQNSVSLQSEIQNLERAVNSQGIPSAERHSTLIRLARLRQSSGDIEGAAKNWLEAAGAIPGRVDDDALLACAYCLAAMGEWDRARAALEPLLVKSARARFLDTSIRAIQSDDISVLSALAANPEYAQLKSEIYFMLWMISKGAASETWRQRLAAEFPQTTEGRLAAGSSSSIIVQPSPFWLSLQAGGSTVTEAARPVQTTAPAQTAPAPAGQRLQTGVFGREANAQAQMTSLRQAGFSPSVERRGEMWAVTVPAGNDTNRTIASLREAGFESFPLR